MDLTFEPLETFGTPSKPKGGNVSNFDDMPVGGGVASGKFGATGGVDMDDFGPLGGKPPLKTKKKGPKQNSFKRMQKDAGIKNHKQPVTIPEDQEIQDW